MEKCLVTGATGFLGHHLVKQLRESKRDVVALVRAPDPMLEALGVTQKIGDVLDEASVRAAATGANVVFHCAGRVSRKPEDAEALYRLHVDGTKVTLDACRAAGVRRAVVASTSGTVAVSDDPKKISTETDETPIGLIARWPYYRSKLFQEEEALAASSAELEVVAINPSLLLGPGDVHGSSTEDVWKFLSRSIPAVPTGGAAYVDARDAAHGAVLAMEKGAPGRRYLLNASNVTVRELFARLSRISGVAAPIMPLPKGRFLATGATKLLGRALGVIGAELPVDVATVEMGQLFWYVDASRAERELGFTTRDPLETLADTVADLLRRTPPALDARAPVDGRASCRRLLSNAMRRPTDEQLDVLAPMEKVAFAIADRVNRWPVLKGPAQAYLRTFGKSWVYHCTKHLLHVYGREKLADLAPDRGVMLASNHRSFFDLYVISSVPFRSSNKIAM